MNRLRKIKMKVPLTLCASALAGILALSAPAQADEPDEELDVTMDVLDSDEPAGAEMIVKDDDGEGHDGDDADSDEDSDEDSDDDEDSDEDSDEDADEHEDDDSDGREGENPGPG